MILEKQVCSDYLSKKLQKLKVSQKSFWFWSYNQLVISSLYKNTSKERLEEMMEFGDLSAAFTASELIEMLPKLFFGKELGIYFSPKGKASVFYADEDSTIYQFDNDSLPNALAKLLINLIEDGHQNLL